jgi:hypothetical protein
MRSLSIALVLALSSAHAAFAQNPTAPPPPVAADPSDAPAEAPTVEAPVVEAPVVEAPALEAPGPKAPKVVSPRAAAQARLAEAESIQGSSLYWMGGGAGLAACGLGVGVVSLLVCPLGLIPAGVMVAAGTGAAIYGTVQLVDATRKHDEAARDIAGLPETQQAMVF